MRGRRPGPGFTLIELLVVVAVIAILAAILFPVFAGAREKARQAGCLSNLKQIGLAILLYADDYDGRYPGGPNWPGSGYLLWVPGPQGSWEKMPTACCGDVAQFNVARLLLPYLKSTRVFLCPSDAAGGRFSGGGKYWQPEVAGYTYFAHDGLIRGISWPAMPKGKPAFSLTPASLTAVSRPALLPIAWDSYSFTHSRLVSGEARQNAVFADGHARFCRYLDLWLPPDQTPWQWDLFNPTIPVDPEKPCAPTCAVEAAQS